MPVWHQNMEHGGCAVILDKLKAYGAIILAAVLGVLLLVQTQRLNSAQLSVERHKTSLAQALQGHAEQLRRISELTTTAYQVALAERDTTNRKRQEALDESRILEAALRVDLRRATTESERMRDQLTYAARQLAATASRAPREVVVEYAAAVTDVLTQCRKELVDMAAKADGHAADARLLERSR